VMEKPVVRASPTILEDARFDDRGLIPVIAQDESTGAVLMLAWMDKKALSATLTEGRVTYFSRSRGEYWRKGDTSGHTQHAVSAAIDCDGDAILLRVHQEGPACHTGQTSCFDQGSHGE
jgi:phosphoribosyl-AMP cyclohydrolase